MGEKTVVGTSTALVDCNC